MYWFTSARLQEPPCPPRCCRPAGATEPAVRHDLVRRVRQEIAAGVYETEARWEAALDRLLDHLE
jgi:hypothetical protein